MEQTLQTAQTFRANAAGLPVVNSADSLVKIRMDVQRYPRYFSVPRDARIEWLSLEIIKYMRLSHMKPSDSRVDAVALDEMILTDNDMADLTQPEMDYAFKQGIFGNYGEYYGVTAISLYKFLQGFLESEIKRDTSKLVLGINERLTADKRKREQEERQKAILAEMEEAKRNGTFVPSGKAWYKPKKVEDVLAKDESEEHRKMIQAQAKAILDNTWEDDDDF